MDNTSDFNGSEFQPDDTNVTDRTEVKVSQAESIPWEVVLFRTRLCDSTRGTRTTQT